MLGRPIQFFLLRMEQFWVLVLGTKIGTSFGTGNRQLLKASANPRPPCGSKNGTKIGDPKMPQIIGIRSRLVRFSAQQKHCIRARSQHTWLLTEHSRTQRQSFGKRSMQPKRVARIRQCTGAGARVDCMAAYTSPGCNQPWVPYRVASKSLPAWHHKTRPQDQMKFQFVGGAADVRSCAGSA